MRTFNMTRKQVLFFLIALSFLLLILSALPRPLTRADRPSAPAAEGGNGTQKSLYLPTVQKNFNPSTAAPVIYSLSPTSAPAGSAAATLTVNGNYFAAGSVVRFGQQILTTQFLGTCQLQALVPGTLLATAGDYTIQVVHPDPNGGLSNPVLFPVVNGTPLLTSLSPTSAVAKSADLLLTLEGNQFLSASRVSFNGGLLTPTWLGSSRMQVLVPASCLTATGILPVKVINPPPGGGSSLELSFTVRPDVSSPPDGSFGKRYEDLIPLDVTVKEYSSRRFALITGLVRNSSGLGLADVTVTVPAMPAWGTARTDAGGRFSLPVEGGGIITLAYQKDGYVAVQRQVEVPGNEVAVAEPVVLTLQDSKSSSLVFDGNPATVLLHQGSTVADNRGSRSPTLVFNGDNTAYSVDASGNALQTLRSITVRATEFAVSAALPAMLPPSSAYTYCVELSVDGASRVRFQKPLVFWVDNFLGFPVGMKVPIGYYSRDRELWIPEPDGVVVRLLDLDKDGRVDALDSTADGKADDLDGSGSFADEVQGLGNAQRYAPGATFWRAGLDHFSPVAAFCPQFLPSDATSPNPPADPIADQQKEEELDCKRLAASSIEERSRIFHEDIPVAGTPITLHYTSSRTKAYQQLIRIPASGTSVPASLQEILVRMNLAGRSFETRLSPLPGQNVQFLWDGLDFLGRSVQGTATADIRIGYVYPGVFAQPGQPISSFGRPGVDWTTIRTRENVFVWKCMTVKLYRLVDFPGKLADGWSLSAHHFLSPADPSVLFKGTGVQQNRSVSLVSTIAGNGIRGYGGDGGPAVQAKFVRPSGIAMDSSGNLYIADSLNFRIRKMDTTGIISTIAGTGTLGTAGNGGPAVSAQLVYPWALTTDRFGNLYFLEDEMHRVRKIDSSGIITTVAGTGTDGFAGDEGPASRAQLSWPSSLAADNAGNLFIADAGNARIRMVDSLGIIHTVAGKEVSGCTGDGDLATKATLLNPRGIAVDSYGGIFIADKGCNLIRKIDSTGRIATVAGTGIGGYSGDGGPALSARISPEWLASDPDGNLYVADNLQTANLRIRKINRAGMIETFAGQGTAGSTGEAVPASQASLESITGLVRDLSGNIYFSSDSRYRARKIASDGTVSGLPGDFIFAEGDGTAHVFSGSGRHQSTMDLDTRKTLLSFEYDAGGLLGALSDRFGNTTRLQRNAQGTPVAVIAPEGQSTALEIDANRLLNRITWPDGSVFQFSYGSGGQLTVKTEPAGNRFTHAFDADGRLTAVSDEESGQWQYAQSTDAAGEITTTVASGEGLVTTYADRTDLTGRGTSRITDPSGGQTVITSSADGLTTHKSLSCGTELDFLSTTDSQYRTETPKELSVQMPSGLKNTTLFQKAYQDTNADSIPDRITETVTINSRATVAQLDTIQSRKTTTTPEGRTTTVSYHPTTLLPTVAGQTGFLDRTFTYDAKGRLTALTAGTRQVLMSYDGKGNLSAHTDAKGRVTQYTYDEMGQVTGIQLPDGSAIAMQYDKNGNRTGITNAAAARHQLGFNRVNRNSSYLTPLGNGYLYSYNRDRQPLSMTFPSGRQIQYVYSQGRLSQTRLPDGNIDVGYLCGSKVGALSRGTESILYTYDGSLPLTDSRAGSLSQTLTFTYNNYLERSSLGYAGATVNYSYDRDGLLTAAGLFTIGRNAGNGLPESVSDGVLSLRRAFSGYGEMESQEAQIAGVKRAAWQLTFDRSGRITAKTETFGGVTASFTYGYDPLGRLRTVSRNGTLQEEYRYGADGNRTFETNALRGITGRTFTCSPEDHLLTAGGYSYQYDADGFLSRKTLGSSQTTYTYSLLGDLSRVELPGGRTVEYISDPLGRRVVKKVNGLVTEKYLWHGLTTLLAVYGADNALRMRFLYGDDRMPLAVAMSGSTYYLAYDQVGTLRAVLDTAGNTVKRLDYDSYGNLVGDTNPALALPFAFAGGLYDADTGLLRFGFRDYDPEVGRWTAKDPIGFQGGDLNLYAYVLNNPISFNDPAGLLSPIHHFFITYGVAYLYSFNDLTSSLLAISSVLADIGPGTQDTTASAANKHAMAGIMPNGRRQAPENAIESTKNFIRLSLHCGQLGAAIHAAQDLATPAHAGKLWEGTDKKKDLFSHWLGDATLIPTTLYNATINTYFVITNQLERLKTP